MPKSRHHRDRHGDDAPYHKEGGRHHHKHRGDDDGGDEDEFGRTSSRRHRKKSKHDHADRASSSAAAAAPKNDEDDTAPCPTFDSMSLKPALLRGIYAYGFEKPSAIQQRAIRPIVRGRDVIAQSQSGTGKTAVFSISALQLLDERVKGE